MSTPAAAAAPVDVDAFSATVTKQASLVRQLKKDGVDPMEIKSAVDLLKDMKEKLERLQKAAAKEEKPFNRKAFDEMLVRKFFVVPSFEIHGGVAGLFDLGPPACALKANVLAAWREHFVLQESMLEMDCTNLTPECVLKTSGHVDRFTDLMVKDVVNGECFRADKLLEDGIDQLLDKSPTMPAEEREEHLRVQRQADAYSAEELGDLLANKYKLKSPGGNAFGPPFPFNLMFRTSIGPEGTSVGYLRPETAQGLFVNFKRLIEYNGFKMPFAAAQIGLGFRNEINPRAGLLRVREFCMAEIEHFVDPRDKRHPSFHKVANEVLTLFGSDQQLGTGKMERRTIGEAVALGLVNNETLGYFMARTQMFVVRIGMDPTRVRFRQHLKTEMAHYAADCWDLEIKNSYGWIECAGHADRACYDLDVHAKATKIEMVATEYLEKPIAVEFAKIKLDRKTLGLIFKENQRPVANAIEAAGETWEAFAPVAASLESTGKATVGGFEVTKDMFTYERKTKTVHEVKFTPSVIEPSFGIGRILYSLFEHSFGVRESDEQRVVMRFRPSIAPVKVALLPLSKTKDFFPLIARVKEILMENNLSCKVDDSTASLGKRYSRADEVGIPFDITVDFESVAADTVTIRERDSMTQVRLQISELAGLLTKLCQEKMTWADACKIHRVVTVDEGEGEEGKVPQASDQKTVVVSTSRGRFSRPASDV